MEQTPLLALRTGRIEGWKYTHHVVDLGTLRLPSGRLEASDPFVALGEGWWSGSRPASTRSGSRSSM